MTELATCLTTDLVAITRGRAFPAAELAGYVSRGTGWVPANMALTPFDIIAEDNPWGSSGDLRLMPDVMTRIRLPGLGKSPLHIYFSDIAELDGTPWDCCPRTVLKHAIEALRVATGLTLQVSFEHEFQLLGAGWAPAPAFSFAAMRRADPFGPELLKLMDEAGLEPEMFLPEYGTDQFEVTMRPAGPLAAADRSIALRLLVQELAASKGWRASFAPKTVPDGVGNGLHIHLSLRDGSGRPVMRDESRPGALSERAGQFCAGIVRHMSGLMALTAPSPLSYLRLQPHHWSAAYACLGERNREAGLRICPTPTLGGADPARTLNVEFRATDATANAYLALAALITAGLDGLTHQLPQPPLVNQDPFDMPAEEREALGVHRLPGDLPTALAAFEANALMTAWLPPTLKACLLSVKRKELALVEGLTPEELCAKYKAVY